MAIRGATISKAALRVSCAAALAALPSPSVAAAVFSSGAFSAAFPFAGAVAEPSTLLLIGAALVAVALYRPRKDRSRKPPSVPPSPARRP